MDHFFIVINPRACCNKKELKKIKIYSQVIYWSDKNAKDKSQVFRKYY
jgi:hypothetical protein